MRRDVLQALVRSGSEGRAVVLVRSLSGGEPFLLDRQGAYVLVEGGRRPVDSQVPDDLLTLARGALARDGARAVEASGEQYLIQTLSPPPRLIIVGAVHIAQKLTPMARLAGYRVLLLDPRAAFASPARFPDVEILNGWPHEVMPELLLDARCAVVTLSHDAKIDEPALQAALASDAFYIGALGSRKNHENRLRRLRAAGFGAAALKRIHGPVGLPLGGRSPAEIAVAILAQMTQIRYQPGREA